MSISRCRSSKTSPRRALACNVAFAGPNILSEHTHRIAGELITMVQRTPSFLAMFSSVNNETGLHVVEQATDERLPRLPRKPEGSTSRRTATSLTHEEAIVEQT
jgi:hypothetical protein